MAHLRIGLVARALLVVGLGFLLACGSGGDDVDPHVVPWSQADTKSASAGPDQVPVVRSIRFEPEKPKPGGALRAVVEVAGRARMGTDVAYTWVLNGREVEAAGPVFEVPGWIGSGDRIEVQVVASNGAASSEPASRSTSIGNRRPEIEEVRIRTRGAEDGGLGFWVADPVAVDADDDPLWFRYEWYLNGEGPVSDEEELARDGRTRGDRIALIVWASDGELESQAFESAPFEIGNSPPDIVSKPPVLGAEEQFVYRVEARDRDGDRKLEFSLVQGPEGMLIDASSGELRWDAGRDEAGEHFVEIAVDDGMGGVTRQGFYVSVASTGG
jgi:hypothetical protein